MKTAISVLPERYWEALKLTKNLIAIILAVSYTGLDSYFQRRKLKTHTHIEDY